jgi:hypothetical protein
LLALTTTVAVHTQHQAFIECLNEYLDEQALH